MKKISKTKQLTKKMVKYPWFKRKGKIFHRHIPINWKGYLALIIFLAFNFFSVFYFNFPLGDLDSIFAFLSVFGLSVFIFSIILIKKTKGVEKEL